MGCKVQKLDIDTWLSAAKQFRDYNYTHYWSYSKHAAQRIAADSEHIAIIDENDNVIALSNIRIKNLPLGLGGIAYISGGPMVDNGQQNFEIALSSALTALHHEYVTKQGLVLRISQRHKISSVCAKEAAVYRKAGFIEYGKTNATILIDLSAGLEDIRKNFHQKWRNVLNKSEKQGIKIISGDDLTLFNDFEVLFRELQSRKAFDVDMNNYFFMKVQDQSPKQEKFHIAIAYMDDQPIAGHLSSITGDTSVYLLGATNAIGRKLGAAYLLQWHVINESKKRECHWYDLGGIDRKENPQVYEFKKRMGGEETPVGFIFQTHFGIRGWLTLILEKAYKHIRFKN